MGHAISVIFPVLTVIIGGACILLFSVVQTLRANNGDLTARVDILEKQRDQLRVEKAADRETFDAKLSATTGQLEALSKVVTGEAQLAVITDLLTTHHTEAVEQWRNLGASVHHMVEILERES